MSGNMNGTTAAAGSSPARTVAIVGGRIVPISSPAIDDATIVVTDGKVVAVGRGLAVPEGARVIDAAGGWVLPGFIEAHGHVGVHEEGEGWAGSDTNELTEPVTAHVRAIDAINPADLGFRDAISGGVLAVNVNPGSGNPIGGQTAALKCWGRTVDEMLLRAPAGMKSALGENPKRVYGERKQTPSTRLGTAAVIRARSSTRRITWLGSMPRSAGPRLTASQSIATSNLRHWAWSCAARSPGASTVTGPTTSRQRCAWRTSSATSS